MRKYLALIILCFAGPLIVKSQDYKGYTHCAEQDSLALVAFYNATGGPAWTSNGDAFNINNIGSDGNYGLGLYETYPNAGREKWLVGPVKNWFGVVMEKQPMGSTKDSAWRVIYITPTLGRREAGNDNMKGYIPREVGLLTALKWFRINGNTGLMQTTIPDELYHSTLTHLDLEAVFLSGIISSSFRKCTKLEEFNIRNNFIDSITTFDFLSKQQLLDHFAGTNMFLYKNQFSYANWEKSVDYFTSFTTTPTIKYQVQNLHDVGRAREILTTPGSTVTLTCNEAGTKGTCTWMRKNLISGEDTSLKVTGTTYTIKNITAEDTGTYKGSLLNPYIAAWQIEGNADVTSVPVLTKPIHVVFTPTTPVCKSFYTSYSGNEIFIVFSKDMSIPTAAQTSQFNVSRNGANVGIKSISLTGRLSDTYVLKLDSSIYVGNNVTISYTPGSIIDSNGGTLKAFSGKAVQNLVREKPVVLNNALTRRDGKGIIVNFDRYIDPATLDRSDFTITQSNNGSQEIVEAIIKSGELDNNISHSIQLAVKDIITDSTATISIGYKKGSMTGLYSGAVQSFSPIQVKNAVKPNRSSVTLHFYDQCGTLKNIVASGSIECLSSFRMYDDGTNGDKVANDHHWTKKITDLVSDKYDWTIYERKITSYDTTVLSGGVKVLTPVVYDSLISSTMFVTFDDKKVGADTRCLFSTGDTIFWKCNKSVVFLLDMKKYIAQNPTATIKPYLMGMSNDWKTGLTMEKITDPNVSGDSVYYVKVDQFNVGDSINFLFRNGDYPNGEWEKFSGPQKRHYTIKGNDTIRIEFVAVPTSITRAKTGNLFIYPNPVNDQLFISAPEEDIFDVKVYNLYGQCSLTVKDVRSSIDVKQLPRGMYVIEALLKNGNSHRMQFIKE